MKRNRLITWDDRGRITPIDDLGSPRRHYRKALSNLLQLLTGAIADRINARLAGDVWEQIDTAAIDALSWADLLASAALRARGLRQPTAFPDDRWESVIEENMWAQTHVMRSGPLIDAEADRFVEATQKSIAKRIGQRETVSKSALQRYHERKLRESAEEALARRSLNRTRAFVPQRRGIIAPEQKLLTPEKFEKSEGKLVHLSAIPEYAIRRFERDSVGTIANDSEQMTLMDPEVAASFPMARWNTRDDARVRPTHRAMQGFVAQRADPIWKIIRPLAGYSCRCFLRNLTIFECKDLGFIRPNGYARFMRKWPNTLSERNFDTGKFPDAGWKGPKIVALAPAIPVEQVA